MSDTPNTTTRRRWIHLEILDALGLADRLLQLPHTKLARMEATTPIDILWFRLPRRVGEQLPSAYMGDGYHLTALERNEEWQIGSAP